MKHSSALPVTLRLTYALEGLVPHNILVLLDMLKLASHDAKKLD